VALHNAHFVALTVRPDRREITVWDSLPHVRPADRQRLAEATREAAKAWYPSAEHPFTIDTPNWYVQRAASNDCGLFALSAAAQLCTGKSTWFTRDTIAEVARGRKATDCTRGRPPRGAQAPANAAPVKNEEAPARVPRSKQPKATQPPATTSGDHTGCQAFATGHGQKRKCGGVVVPGHKLCPCHLYPSRRENAQCAATAASGKPCTLKAATGFTTCAQHIRRDAVENNKKFPTPPGKPTITLRIKMFNGVEPEPVLASMSQSALKWTQVKKEDPRTFCVATTAATAGDDIEDNLALWAESIQSHDFVT
jgi:hypothetical protein